MGYPELTAQQIKAVIEGRGAASRIPMLYHFWCQPQRFGPNEATARELMAQYPFDIQYLSAKMPEPTEAPADNPTYRWIYKDPDAAFTGGLDSHVHITDWDDLDEILARFPSPEYPNMFPKDPPKTEKYRLVTWWFCFFERFWSLRGMENSLMDFYLYPEKVHQLFQKLTDFYCRVIQRAHDELGADGVFTSDDIGTQNAPFFSEEIFLEFFKPYYQQLIEKAHSLGMHFWLHTCGNVKKFIPHFIEIGLDVLHPIQKYTMEEAEIAREFGNRLCIWAGFDVQRIIPYGTPQEVRQEVRHLIDTYSRPDGRFMLTCGNGLTEDCPIESFRALLDESYHYGLEKMNSLR